MSSSLSSSSDNITRLAVDTLRSLPDVFAGDDKGDGAGYALVDLDFGLLTGSGLGADREGFAFFCISCEPRAGNDGNFEGRGGEDSVDIGNALGFRIVAGVRGFSSSIEIGFVDTVFLRFRGEDDAKSCDAGWCCAEVTRPTGRGFGRGFSDMMSGLGERLRFLRGGGLLGRAFTVWLTGR